MDAKAGRARFTVERLYKGVVQGTEVEIRYNNSPGSSCGTGFTAGGTETVFANGDTGSFVTGMCHMIPYQSAPLKFQPALDAYRLAVLEAAAVTDREPVRTEMSLHVLAYNMQRMIRLLGTAS